MAVITTPTLFIESTPFSFEASKNIYDLIALSDGSFIECSKDTAKRWLLSTTTTTSNNDTKTLDCISTFRGHTSAVWRAVEKDSNTLITLSFDHTLKEWNIRTCECVSSVDLSAFFPIDNLIMTKDKSKLLCVSGGCFYLRRASDLSLITTFRIHQSSAMCCCELEDGSFVSCASDYTFEMIRWDVEGIVLHTFYGHSESILDVIELEHDIIVGASFNHILIMWKVSTGECLRTLNQHHMSVPQLIKLSNNKFVSWDRSSTMRVWNHKGDCIETVPTEYDVYRMMRVDNYIVTMASSDSEDCFTFRRLR